MVMVVVPSHEKGGDENENGGGRGRDNVVGV